MNAKTIAWLLQGEPWIEYRTRLDPLGQSESDPEVRAARKAMLADPKIKSLPRALRCETAEIPKRFSLCAPW